MNITAQDRAVAWVTMWGECRGEPPEGQRAVASVILNRASNPRWWGCTVTEVCQTPALFSCWNADDPQSVKLRAMIGPDGLLTLEAADKVSALSRAWIAIETGELGDPTSGATHYLTPAAYAAHQRRGKRGPASWSFGATPCARIGGHLFFRPLDIGEVPISPWRPVPNAPPPRPWPDLLPPTLPTPSHPGLIAMLIAWAARLFGGKPT